MQVFISSVVDGFEKYRDAAAAGIEMLRHGVIRSEELSASPNTPQQACLSEVRRADVVVLLLGERYGVPQPSGQSATHEEYLEARERKPVLVFLQAGVAMDPPQREFVREVQGWAEGKFSATFTNPDDLKTVVVRALHDYQVALATGSGDVKEMVARASQLLGQGRNPYASGSSSLTLVVVAGPHQQVLRPSALEEESFITSVEAKAVYGPPRLFDPAQGTTHSVSRDSLSIQQTGRSILLNQAGSIRVMLPTQDQGRRQTSHLPSLIVEDIQDLLARILQFAGWLMNEIDEPHRLTDVVVVARLTGSSYMPWKTRRQQAESPNWGQIGNHADPAEAMLTPPQRPRAALLQQAELIAEDLTTILRRAGAR